MEIKVVMTIKDNKAVVGVQSPGMDPVFTMIEGDLQHVVDRVPVIVTAAQEKWKLAPKNPAIALPSPAAPVAASSKAGSSSAKAKAVPSPQVQPPMFG